MTEETAIEMFVGGLVLDPNTQTPVVVLKDETGNVALPIWIGVAEATSIASVIKQVAMQRPLTHDLMIQTFQEIGVSVQRIMINELKDSTYFAELILAQGDKIIMLDARPSDAIAIALRAHAPIFVASKVIEQARMHFTSSENAPSDPVAGAAEVSPLNPDGTEDPTGGGPDFKNISKDKWQEILKELDPDDFKYKM